MLNVVLCSNKSEVFDEHMLCQYLLLGLLQTYRKFSVKDIVFDDVLDGSSVPH